MEPCVFCADKPIQIGETPSWLIGLPVQSGIFKSYNSVPLPSIDRFESDIRFTPAARLSMSTTDASHFLAHQTAWLQFSTMKSHHGAFFDSYNTPNYLKLLESTQYPRDWDIILISDTAYVATQRAVSVLLTASKQIHETLPIFLKSIPLLKVVPLK